jgi:manganese efflux pump family protein
MTPATTLLLAFSISLDAFAAALSNGAALKGQRLLDALRTGVIFGVIEAITPVIGWAFGFALSMWIREIDHWVAFILLSTNILTVAAAIGVATFIMAAVGTLAGQWVGPRFGKVAEVIGGLCLIAIGVRILIEHTLGGGSETVDIFFGRFPIA